MMDTAVTVKPGRTTFRTNIRPRIDKNRAVFAHSNSYRTSPCPATSSPSGPTSLPSGHPADLRLLKPMDAASASLFSVLDRFGWSVRVEHADKEIIREHSASQQDTSIYADTNRMFNATLDAVIMIANSIGGFNGAGKVDISDEHLLWSEGFLMGVRDRYGNHPPNVCKLLDFIRHLWEDKVVKDAGGAADSSHLFLQTYQNMGQANMTRIPAQQPPSTV